MHKNMKWSEVKKEVSELEKRELVSLVGELYKLDTKNKRFFHTRFSSSSEILEEYKELISYAVNPPLSPNAKINFLEAKKIISTYKKAKDDQLVLADLMLYYVEEANQQTLGYGDMWEEYYTAIENMFHATLEHLRKLCNEGVNVSKLLKRALTVVESTNGIGWGYHDQLKHVYYHFFPDE